MSPDIPDFPRSILCASDFHFGCGVWNLFRLAGKRLLGQLNYHLRRRNHLDYAGRTVLRHLVEQTRPAAVVLPGDFTNLALPEEFRTARAFLEELAATGVALYAIPGNHDVYTHSAVRNHAIEQWLGPFLPPGGIPSVVTIPGVATLCFLPTVRPNRFSSRGEIPPEGWTLLETLPRVPDPSPILMVSHYPLLNRTTAYRQNWSHQLRQADRALEQLRKLPGPIFFLAGHVHRFSITRDPVNPNLLHATLPAAFHTRSGNRVSVVLLQPDSTDAFRVFSGHWDGQTWHWMRHSPVYPPD